MTNSGNKPSPLPSLLNRELGVVGATMLGLGSIVGTGVFVSIGIAAGVAGPTVLVSIALAAVLALCNALSSAQLAAAYPLSGGTYEYGYRLLRPEFGFTAGWMFLCAKTASAATAALGAAGYGLHLLGVTPDGILPWVGFVIAIAITILVLSGLKRSSYVNVIIVSLTLAALAAFSVIGLVQIGFGEGRDYFVPFLDADLDGGVKSVLYATALMFVAYTGYGRIATMGEKVRDPQGTIPKAIIATLAVSALIYVLVAVAAIGAVGTQALSGAAGGEATPLETAAQALDVPGLAMLVALGAVTAMLGVLLNLVLGLSRVALAMGRRADLPPLLGILNNNSSPQSAIIFVGLAIAALSLAGDVETTWGFSAFTVLIYYALTNLAAIRLPREQRLYPAFIAWVGLAGCLSLAAFLPQTIWLPGLAFLAVGLVWHFVAKMIWPRHHEDERSSS